jgi:hypothetical protein
LRRGRRLLGIGLGFLYFSNEQTVEGPVVVEAG